MSQRPYLLISPWVLHFQPMNFEGHKHSNYSRRRIRLHLLREEYQGSGTACETRNVIAATFVKYNMSQTLCENVEASYSQRSFSYTFNFLHLISLLALNILRKPIHTAWLLCTRHCYKHCNVYFLYYSRCISYIIQFCYKNGKTLSMGADSL